ncbi:uncharacterized protein [Branchiostoma lanceolatum]|uniref:uncharacterized protein n=1 Tax=Branchiostoma lanceolatum TaxID=7740 RepID=UPI00345341F0
MAEGTGDGLSILDRIKQFDSSSQPTQPVSHVKPKKPSLKKRPGQKAHVISSHGHIAKSKPPPLTKKISSHRLVMVEKCVTSPKSKNADFSSRLPTSPSKPIQLSKPALKPPVANRSKPLRPMRSVDDDSKPSPPKTKPVVATRNKVNAGTGQNANKNSAENFQVEARESAGSISALAKKFEAGVSTSSTNGESSRTNGHEQKKPKIVQRKISKEPADVELEESTPKSVAQKWKTLEQSTAASSKQVPRTPEKVPVKKFPPVVTSTSGSMAAVPGEVVQQDVPAPKSFLHQNRPSRQSRSGSRKSPSAKTRPLLPSDGRDKVTAVTVEEDDWDEDEEYEDVLLPPRKVPSEGKVNDSDSWETDEDDDYMHEYHDIYESIAISPPNVDVSRQSKSTVVPKPTLPPPPVPSKPVRDRLARNSAASEDAPSGAVNTVPKPPRTTGKRLTPSPNPPDRVASLVDAEEATNKTKTAPATIPRNIPQIKVDIEKAKNKKIPPVEGSSPQTKGLGKYTGVKSFLHNMLAKSKSGGDLTVDQSLNPSSCPDTLSPLASAALEGRNWKSLEKLGEQREEYEHMASTKKGAVGVPNLPRRDDRPPATLPRDLTVQQWSSMDSDTYMGTEYLDIVEFPDNPQGGDDDLYVLPDNGDDEVYEDVLVSRGVHEQDMSEPLSGTYMDFDEVPTLQQPNAQMERSEYETPMFPGGEMPAFLTPINQRVEPAHSDNADADLRVDYVARTNNRQSRFFHEPLYQVYRAQKSARSIRSNRSDAITEEELDVVQEDDDDDYENVASMSASEASLKRTMWKDLPEVRGSGVLNSLSPAETKLQEALFEVVTSEASYLRSLNILVDHFMPGLIRPLSRTERTHLFSNCKEVRDQSERLLLAMEAQLQKDIRLSRVPDLVLNHARSYFEEYIKYCRNLVYQERVLRRLTTENSAFHTMLQKLEVDRMCAGLDLQSFLILPMQRIARMPLLFDAIIQRAEAGTSLYNSAYRAYKFLNKTLKACNEEARIMAKTEEMVLLQKQFTFKPGVKEIAVVSGKRYLVKKGELTQITQEKKKYLRQPLHLFLFTDLLLVTKKKSDSQYTIIDYAERSFVEAKEKEDPDFALAATKLTATQKIRRFTGTLTIPPIESLFTMELFENHEGKHVMIDLATTLSEKTRWVEAIMPPKSDISGETIYEEWDCPQVQVIHPYQAQQPDELELERSDIINVSRKMADGWYEGERIRDGEKGWFPSSYTEEIENSHARARNLKYRHRRQLSLGEA